MGEMGGAMMVMCVVSMIMDHYWEKWNPYLPPTNPYIPSAPFPPSTLPPPFQPNWLSVPVPSFPTVQEIEEFKKLLERARKYDKDNSEPDCELQEKKDKLLKLAKELGVEIDFL